MTNHSNPWDDVPQESAPMGRVNSPKKTPRASEPVAPPVVAAASNAEFDIEGLMTDFPTATDLERFVFDQTQVVLNLKGRANKLKYQVAMDVLNGSPVDAKYIGAGNPYLDKADMVPEEPMKTLPPRSLDIPPIDQVQNQFFTAFVPHSNEEYRSQGRKMHVNFRKYNNGMITYEVLGPIEPKPFGEKIDKFGRVRPEIIKWIDPRTGEQIVQREDGTLTPIGRRLKGMMQTFKFNDSNQWIKYVDREFITLDQRAAENPWDLDK